MKMQKNVLARFIPIFSMALLLLIMNPLAMGAEWDIDAGNGACYKKNSYKSKPKYCGNCKKAGGDNVQWKFRVTCDKKMTKKEIKVSLKCGRSTPTEGRQRKYLRSAAKKKLPNKKKPCPK